MRLGLIGHGAIGQAIVEHLAQEGCLHELVAILKRTPGKADACLPVRYTMEGFLAEEPDVVIEAAGHEAALRWGPAVLASGARLVVSSVGIFASDEHTALFQQGRTIIPAGAIAGLDGLMAARLAGLDEVMYTSSKPPSAWRGTSAEAVLDLDHAADEVTFFDGTAREAARSYPQNANVSAAIALAGIGFDRTRVRLVSSRRIGHPLGIIDASGAFGSFHFRILANAFASNPKSSMLTAYSLLQCARHGTGIPLPAEPALA